VSGGARWEREGKICKIFACTRARVPSSSSFSFKFFEQGMAGVVLGAMLVIDYALVLDIRETRFCFKKEE
jgi:hypothetical protein